MQDQGLSPPIKIEQPPVPHPSPQDTLRSQFIFRRPLFNPEHFFPHNRDINNSPQPLRKRRNASLKLKSEPSEEKMRKIDEKKSKYRRSTNNSHKKYTAVARRLLLKYLSQSEINRFETVYESLKNSRTYYFIILAHVKFLLTGEQIRQFQNQFQMLLNNKMEFYRKEIQKTNNRNFINFRMAQIAQIKYAIKAFNLYFLNKVQKAVEVIYKKNKNIIIKKNQYQQTIQIIESLEAKLKERSTEKFNDKNKANECQPALNGLFSSAFRDRGFRHQEEDAVAQESDRGSSLNQSSKKNHKIEETKVYPLVGLENSYPYFESFYPIMFPYGEGSCSQPISLNLIYSQLQFELLEQQLKDKESHQFIPQTKAIFTKFQSFQEQPFIITPHPAFRKDQGQKKSKKEQKITS